MRKLLQNHKPSEPLVEPVHFTDGETEAKKGISQSRDAVMYPGAFICKEA